MKILVLFLLSLNLFASDLRWAADTSSGAPFAFSHPKHPEQLIGFEVDIIKAIAKELGKKDIFVQNSWDGLILGLKGQNYDVAINGIEITDDRKKEVLFSDPYYITFEQLTVRQENNDIKGLSDCKNRRIGTLKSAVAERILNAEGNIIVVEYDEETSAYMDLENGRLDGVLLDAPIAQYYAAPNPKLKNVGPPIGQLLYGIAIRKEDAKLHQAINTALKKIIERGQLREILDSWNLWNPLIATQLNDFTPSQTPPNKYREYLKLSGNFLDESLSNRLQRYKSFIPLLVEGTFMTLKISVFSMALAIFGGLFLCILRMYSPRPLAWFSILIIECIRGTPLLIQLLFLFYGLPSLGIKLSPLIAAVLGLGLNYAAYEAENYRAGIQSVPKTQVDSAMALGMNKWQALFHVVIPHALRIVIPPVTNDFISLLKDSSLVSVITMVELTKVYSKLSTTYFDYLGTGIIVALIYLLIGLPFVRFARYWEKKLSLEKKLGKN